MLIHRYWVLKILQTDETIPYPNKQADVVRWFAPNEICRSPNRDNLTTNRLLLNSLSLSTVATPNFGDLSSAQPNRLSFGVTILYSMDLAKIEIDRKYHRKLWSDGFSLLPLEVHLSNRSQLDRLCACLSSVDCTDLHASKIPSLCQATLLHRANNFPELGLESIQPAMEVIEMPKQKVMSADRVELNGWCLVGFRFSKSETNFCYGCFEGQWAKLG